MSRLISDVVDINPNLKKTWTVLVQVLENSHVQETISKRRFKRHLRYFATLLTQYKRYYISNAVVIDNEPKYRISSYLYSWILNNKTPVEEFVDTVPMTLASVFEFTKFSDLHRYAETETLQNVRAIVLHCFPIKEQGPGLATRRDIVIVNEEKILLLLTLWQPFDEQEGNALANMLSSGPMIFGMRLRVTTFNCISITTRSASGFMINPPATTELQMQDWYNTNKRELQTLLQMKAYKNTNMLLPYPKDIDIVPVATVVSSLKTFRTGWIKGKTSLPRQQSNFWYTACLNCHKSLDADLSWIVTCPSCRLESEVEARSRITIHIDDGTSTVSATIYTPNAEKLIPFTAVELKEADENSMDLQKDIAESIEQHTIVAFIRSYEATSHGKSETRLNVLEAYTLDEELSPTNMISLPAKEISNVQASGFDLAVTTPPTSNTKEQLFSPSTKLIVEEIGSNLASKSEKNIASKSAKRSLTFPDEDYLCKTNTTANKPLHTLVSIKKEAGAQGTAESTDKKTKDATSIKEIAARSAHGSPNKKAKD